MSTASDAARARDEAETKAEALYAAAVTYVASRAAGNEEEDEDDTMVVFAAFALALALIILLPAWFGSDIDTDALGVDHDDYSDDAGPELARKAVQDAEQHFQTVKDRTFKNDPEATVQDAVEAFKADDAWVKAASRSSATQAAAQTALDMLPLVDEQTGVKHELLWVSRGDHRVRKSHRHLHGKVKALGKAFKVFPSGQTLRFPGDPLAPLGETINCRCGLLLVPAAQARSAMDIFQVKEAQWETIDQLAASVGWVDVPGIDRAVDDLIQERQHN